MNIDSPHRPPLEVSKKIDALCDQFEGEFRVGLSPHIEDFLLKVDESYRPALFQELLGLEVDLRLELTKSADVFPALDGPATITSPLSDDPESEYRLRFPQYADLVTRVVCRTVAPRYLGDYELLREIGSGGMGVVYKAVQKYLNQPVAIKVLPQRFSDDPQTVLRFRREMFLIGELNHPNVVRALYAGESKGFLYLVMELVSGTTLQGLMESAWNRYITDESSSERYRMSPGAACEVVRQAALGLAHLSQFGLVHRDVKPANLMITGDGIVKLFDLGLGKFDFGELTAAPSDSTLTRIGTMMGTLDYMAPEQWTDSASVDIRADIYSLGCTLYFMLTNTPPYTGPEYASKRDKFLAHLSGPLPSLDDVLHTSPMGIDAVYRRMLAKEPTERFQTPEELAAAMEPFADHQELMHFFVGVLDPAKQDVAACLSVDGMADKAGLPWFRRPKTRDQILGFALGAVFALAVIGVLTLLF
ncbi:MAG: serine/threonine protein kinase [Planctomycetaceae bacterium]|nr:serine/threonine protein kinase [Planctomycetaceae bacterium]